ncbi:phosphatidylinositol-glycan biosynthesis class W protein-like isoform X1 [Crassostrea angulata]|uniref:phosphatidylinositol-glycan biosynthesis class W protein-like isoform X1 n=1 Tax=Magallana angulata TaxID=2784310 RepID=UPI0022B18DD7|nr:phosphatidylinositol-glycan biosynthesis class W protein-like isoform X1 [Crassostrea angulata]
MGDINYTSYKELKEQFVSGHQGSPAAEITLIYLGIACCVLLHNAGGVGYRKQWFHWLGDFLVLVLPGLSSVTFLSESKAIVIVTLLSLAVISLIISHQFNRTAPKPSASLLRQEFGNKLEFVSNFRAYALICTAICILAVDFNVFPRRFCKAETFGTGLMDTGVGLFIVANGIVSPESRNKEKVSSLKSSLLSSLPLIVLGLGRVVSTKGVNYQEHVTEYGVHWNFFFTVSAVKICSSLLLTILGNINLTGPAIILILSYQLFLTKLGLSEYLVLGADGQGGRVRFFDSNREGIVSCLGYLSLYFLAVELGKHIFNKERKTVGDWVPFLGVLGLLQAVLWCTMMWSETHVQQVSRRFANLSYIVWILALSVFLLFLLLLIDLFSHNQSFIFAKKKEEDVCLLSAVNYNGLLYFLLANVLTGLVNLSIDTLQLSTAQSMTILISYMGILSFVTLMLYKWKIRLKFW